MSQHLYATQHHGAEVVVTLGYDRPLRQVFMTIAPSNKPQQPLYSSWAEPNHEGLSLDDLSDKLDKLGIVDVPSSIFESVWMEQMFNDGNSQVVWHDAQGQITTTRPSGSYIA